MLLSVMNDLKFHGTSINPALQLIVIIFIKTGYAMIGILTCKTDTDCDKIILVRVEIVKKEKNLDKI